MQKLRLRQRKKSSTKCASFLPFKEVGKHDYDLEVHDKHNVELALDFA